MIMIVIITLFPVLPVKESPCNVERSHPCSDGCSGQTRNVSVFFVFKILSHSYDFLFWLNLRFFNCVRNFISSNYKYLLLCDWWQHILQVWPVGCPKVHLDHRQDDHTYHHNHLHHYQPHHHHHHQICYMHLGRLRDECIGNACHPLQRRTRTIVLHFRRLQILRWWWWYHFIIWF